MDTSIDTTITESKSETPAPDEAGSKNDSKCDEGQLTKETTQILSPKPITKENKQNVKSEVPKKNVSKIPKRWQTKTSARTPFTAPNTPKQTPARIVSIVSFPIANADNNNTSSKIQQPSKNSARMLPSTKSFIGTTPTKKNDGSLSARSSKISNTNATVLNPAKKVSSMIGDHDNGGLSARERVAEKNKLKVFESLQRKLEDLQSEFIEKFHTLKNIAPDKIKEEFRFIKMVRSDECRLMVQPSDLIKMPKLPAESINDLKQKIKDAAEDCLLFLIEGLKNAQNILNSSERSLILEDTYNKLESEQTKRLDQLFEYFEQFCDKKAVDYESINTKLQRDIQDTKNALKVSEEQLDELQKFQEQEIHELNKTLSEKDKKIEKAENEVIRKINNISELNTQMQRLEVENEQLKLKIERNSDLNNIEKDRYISEMNALNEKIVKLQKKAKQDDDKITLEKIENNELQEKLRLVMEDLEITKMKLEENENKAQIELKATKNVLEENMHKVEAELKATRHKLEECEYKAKNESFYAKMKLEEGSLKLQEELEKTKQELEKTRVKAQEDLNSLQKVLEDKQLALQKELVETKQKLAENQILAEAELNELKQQLELNCQNAYNKSYNKENGENIKKYHDIIEALEKERYTLIEDLNSTHEELQNNKKLLESVEFEITQLRESVDYYEIVMKDTPPMRKADYEELKKLRNIKEKKEQEINELKSQIEAIRNNEEHSATLGELVRIHKSLTNTIKNNRPPKEAYIDVAANRASRMAIDRPDKFNNNGDRIVKLNKQLFAKTEEFQNLFSTLSHKQIELVRHEHMVRLLISSNERSQMLRVRMEEKLATMEEEIRHLKHTIRIYQQHIIKMI